MKQYLGLARAVGSFSARTLLPTALLIASPMLVMFVLFSLFNVEMSERSSQVSPLFTESGATSKSPIVRLLIHRILTDENAVEASVAIFWHYDDIPKELLAHEKCMTVRVGDRTSQFLAGSLSIDCTRPSTPKTVIQNGMAVESSRFKLNTYSSVWGFPFDNISFLPSVEATFDAGDQMPGWVSLPVVYDIEKLFAGRLFDVKRDRLNWEIFLVRPAVEQVFVLGSSLVFVLLTLMVTTKLCSRNVKLSGLQEIVAVAGFLVAIASFRDLLGVSHTNGRTALEILVFGFALGAPSVGIALSAWRSRKTEF